MKPRPYTRLSVSAKQAAQLDAMREPAVRCPACGVQTGVADLLQHVNDRCAEQLTPHPKARWINWRQALELGVPRGTMSRWVSRGMVRVRGGDQQHYLMRDLVVRLARRRTQRR